MYYHVLQLDFCKVDSEILIAFLSSLPFESFEYTSTGIKAYIKSSHFDQKLVDACQNTLQNYRCESKWLALKNENWNKIWEANFKPIKIPGFCKIRADFHSKDESVEHDIIINPRMAFGTGHHETTFMMMESMANIEFAQKKVLDFGSGTGILAILSEKLGAKDVLAVDNDPQSLVNSKENIDINNMRSIRVSESSEKICSESDFDIILANINRNVLRDYGRRLFQLLNSKGLLVLSGILVEDQEMINEHFISLGFYLVKTNQKGEWINLVLEKRD